MPAKGPFGLVLEMAAILDELEVPGAPTGIWVTSPEDQVLRKMDWFRQSGSMSDRQWRDVVGILRVHGETLDRPYLWRSAEALDLSPLLDDACRQAGVSIGGGG